MGSYRARRLSGVVVLATWVWACGNPAPSTTTSSSATTAPPEPVVQNIASGLDGGANTLAFSARIDSPDNGDIYTVGVDGRGLTRITESKANEYSASWSPDGKKIVFRSAPSSEPSEQNPSDIAVVTLADRSVTFLTHDAKLGNWSPAWSPTGEWIAYYSGGSEVGLHLINPDGTGRHRIVEGDAEYPTWSPDGKQLAFMSLGFPPGSSSLAYEIYIVDADGANLRRLTHANGEDGWPAWSHDGTLIAYTHMDGPDEEIHIVKPDGSDDHAITGSSDGLAHSYPSWSPTDRYIAYSGYPQGEGSTLVGGMFAMRPDGTETLLIMADGVGPVWQPEK